MKICGLEVTIPTEDNTQDQYINNFWNIMTRYHLKENLRGVAYEYTNTTMNYMIGLKNNSIPRIPDTLYSEFGHIKFIELQIPNSMKHEEYTELQEDLLKDGTAKFIIKEFENSEVKFTVYK